MAKEAVLGLQVPPARWHTAGAEQTRTPANRSTIVSNSPLLKFGANEKRNHPSHQRAEPLQPLGAPSRRLVQAGIHIAAKKRIARYCGRGAAHVVPWSVQTKPMHMRIFLHHSHV
eukprot:scaffold3721_cov134-Isochrysis_galbana.AAC.14